MKLNRRKFFASIAALPVVAKAGGAAASAPPAPGPQLTLKQQELMAATEPEILFTGGRGSGMTFGSQKWLEAGRHSLWIIEDWTERGVRIPHVTVVATLDELLSRRFAGIRFDRIAFDVGGDRLRRGQYLTFRNWWPDARFLIATTSPSEGTKHWLYRYFFYQPNRRVIHATMNNNPHLADYRKMILSQSDPLRSRLLNGDWETQ